MVTAISLFIVEGSFIQIPMNTSALEGTTAQFNCTADGADTVTYLVNNMTYTDVASIGVTLSAPVYSGNQATVYLYIPVTRSINNWPVVCIAYLPDGACVFSPPAYIQVQGLCQCNVLITVSHSHVVQVIENRSS